MKITKVMLLMASAGMILAGCSSTPVAPPAEQPKPPEAKKQDPYNPPAAKPTAVLPAYLDPNSPIYKQRSIYFDFDKYVVKSEYNSVVELQGKYLASQPTVNVRLEGNADERGTTEYNLALSQKRAQAVFNAMKVFGASAGQMEVVGLGKEKPKATGHDEAAWAENRRVDIQYPSK